MVSLNAVIGHILVGRYRIEKLRSEGTASAPVFDARDTHQNRNVAVRLMTISSLFDREGGIVDENSAMASFKSSMQQLFSISHPSLVSIEDWGPNQVDNGTPQDDTRQQIFVRRSQVTADNWISIDAPLTLANKNNIGLIIMENINGSSLTNFYMDNIYFYRP